MAPLGRWILAALAGLILTCCSARETEPPTARTSSALTSTTRLYLHSDGNALTLVTAAPSSTTAAFSDSDKMKLSPYDNPWVDMGTWSASPGDTHGTLGALTARLWIGLDSVADRTGNFDLRLEVAKNGVVVATQDELCVGGLSEDPTAATPVTVPFGSFTGVPFDGATDVLAFHVQTRIGTDETGALCDGHRRHVQGLHLYYDASDRASSVDTTISLDVGPRWVVVACTFVPGATASLVVYIDSWGGYYRGLQGAGALLPTPAPTPMFQLSALDLSKLLAAAQVVQTSTAGYTTTTGPVRHFDRRDGSLYSSGAPSSSKLVQRYTDGFSYGSRTFVTLDVPAAAEVLRWSCYAGD